MSNAHTSHKTQLSNQLKRGWTQNGATKVDKDGDTISTPIRKSGGKHTNVAGMNATLVTRVKSGKVSHHLLEEADSVNQTPASGGLFDSNPFRDVKATQLDEIGDKAQRYSQMHGSRKKMLAKMNDKADNGKNLEKLEEGRVKSAMMDFHDEVANDHQSKVDMHKKLGGGSHHVIADYSEPTPSGGLEMFSRIVHNDRSHTDIYTKGENGKIDHSISRGSKNDGMNEGFVNQDSAANAAAAKKKASRASAARYRARMKIAKGKK